MHYKKDIIHSFKVGNEKYFIKKSFPSSMCPVVKSVGNEKYFIKKMPFPNFLLLKDEIVVCSLLGKETTIWGSKKMEFIEDFVISDEILFPDDRLAIRCAIAFLNNKYEAQ